MVSSFVSWPLNPEDDMDSETDVTERGRLKFSSDAVDFFSRSGQVGVSSSNRLRGIVLHDILADVVVPEDLHKAVRKAELSGLLTSSEAEEAEAMLSKNISDVMDRGWFPSDRSMVKNETAIIDSDGRSYRPDRVIVDGNRVTIIDFKFGAHEPKYIRQLERYAGLWKRMKEVEVSAFLWYLPSGEIKDV